MRIIDLAELVASRCMDVLDFSPVIRRPKPIGEEVLKVLEYNIDKVKATGFVITGDINKEIDSTLRYCEHAFGRPK